MKKISYKIILLVLLISLPLSTSILIIAREKNKEYIKEKTLDILSFMPHFYTENIKKDIYVSNNTIDFLEIDLTNRLDKMDIEKLSKQDKEEFLNETRNDLKKIMKNINISWIYFFLVPEFIDLERGVSVYKEENRIFEEKTQDPRKYKKDDPNYAWYFDPLKKGDTWTSLYEWKGETLISHSRPFKYKGKIVGIIGADIKFTKLREDISSIKIGEKGYAYLFDKNLKLLVHPTLEGENLYERSPELGEKLKTEFLETDKTKYITEYLGPEGDKKIGVFYKLETGYIIAFAPYYKEIFKPIDTTTKQLLIVALMVTLIGIILAFIIGNLISKPLLNFVKDFVKLSNGDLTVRSQVYTNDEIKTLSYNFNIFISNLNSTITEVKKNADNIAQLAQHSNHFSEELATKSGMQASSFEDTAKGLDKMNNIIQFNAETTINLGKSMLKTGTKATKILEISDSLEKFIEEMNNNSKEIDNIIDVMNEISFQTNLLAINIAIEASRESSENKGLMVISKEVRNLSRKSSLFSKEIKDIIKKDISKRQEGKFLVKRTVEDLNSILNDIRKNNKSIQEISIGAEDQRKEVKHIEDAMNDLENMTQDNLEISKETVNLSEKVYSESLKFLKLVKWFKQYDK